MIEFIANAITNASSSYLNLLTQVILKGTRVQVRFPCDLRYKAPPKVG